MQINKLWRSREPPFTHRAVVVQPTAVFFMPIFIPFSILISLTAKTFKKTTQKIGGNIMDFIEATVDLLQILVIALGAGLGVWGVVNLLEGYGNDSATLISM